MNDPVLKQMEQCTTKQLIEAELLRIGELRAQVLHPTTVPISFLTPPRPDWLTQQARETLYRRNALSGSQKLFHASYAMKVKGEKSEAEKAADEKRSKMRLV